MAKYGKAKYGKARILRRGGVTTVRVVERQGRGSEGQGMPALPPLPQAQVPPDLDTLKVLDSIAFNASAEKAFVALLSALCDAMPDGVPIIGLRAEVAFRLNISTETAKRYIEKWCYAFSAPFTVRDGAVFRKEK